MSRAGAGAHVAFALAVTSVGALPVWMLSAYAPSLQRDLGLGATALGVTIAAYFALSSVTGMPGGRLVERVGWRRGVVVSAAISALSLLAVALVARSWATLVLAVAIGALANGPSQPAANQAIAEGVDRGRHGLAFGVKQAALPVSTLLVGLSVELFDQPAQWRAAFGVGAALALALVAAAAVRLIRDTNARRTRTTEPAPVSARVRHRVPPALKLLSAGAGFGTAATISLGGFLPVYAVDRGLDLGAAGRLLALGSIVGIASRVVSGLLADRRTGRHLVMVSAMMGAGAVGLLVLAAFGGSGVGLAIGTLLAFGLGWSWNGVFHLAVVRY